MENKCINSYNEALNYYNELLKKILSDDSPKSYPELFEALRVNIAPYYVCVRFFFKDIRDLAMEKFHSEWISEERSANFVEYTHKIKHAIDEKERQVFQINEDICEA